MNIKQKISIAMCTFNGESYLDEQLQSILTQSTLPDELVVCDDRSTDDTLEILYAFRDKCAFPVKIFKNPETLWVTKNFEKAINNCSSEIIVLADQDDIWQPNKLETITKAFQNNPHCGYVFSNADLVDENGKLLRLDLWKSIGFSGKRLEKYKNAEQMNVMLKGGNFVYGMTMAFRSIYKSSLLPIESRTAYCAHDTWIPLMLSGRGAYGVALSEALVKYRQHEKQVVGAYRPVSFKNSLTKILKNTSEEGLAFADSLDSIAVRLQLDVKIVNLTLNERKQLTDKAMHIRSRFLANSSVGFQKFRVVFREMLSGRYSRFSGGFKSVIKDLFVS